jgi:hypothetical protein
MTAPLHFHLHDTAYQPGLSPDYHDRLAAQATAQTKPYEKEARNPGNKRMISTIPATAFTAALLSTHPELIVISGFQTRRSTLSVVARRQQRRHGDAPCVRRRTRYVRHDVRLIFDRVLSALAILP